MSGIRAGGVDPQVRGWVPSLRRGPDPAPASLHQIAPPMPSSLFHRLVRLALLTLLLSLPVGPAAELSAQEFRVTAGNAAAPNSELVGGNGWGYGVRYFHWEGLGFGIERDQYTNDSPILLEHRPGGVGEPRLETFDFTTRTNTTVLIVLLAFRARPDLHIRIGGGRSASVIRTRGVGRDSGAELEVPDADKERGPIAWSRGADGNLVVFEATWELPIPSPVPVSLYGAFRRHDVTMSGCGDGFTPLCGQLNHREIQFGGHVHLFPRRERR